MSRYYVRCKLSQPQSLRLPPPSNISAAATTTNVSIATTAYTAFAAAVATTAAIADAAASVAAGGGVTPVGRKMKSDLINHLLLRICLPVHCRDERTKGENRKSKKIMSDRPTAHDIRYSKLKPPSLHLSSKLPLH